ncbi:MAG: alpha/beta hydrolase [Vampirovibrionia bacterium]
MLDRVMSTVSSLNSISPQPLTLSSNQVTESSGLIPTKDNSPKVSQAEAPPRSQHPKIIALQDLFRPKILLNKILLKVLYPSDSMPTLAIPTNFKHFEKLGALIEPKYIFTEEGRRILTYHMKHVAGERNTQVYFHGNAGNINTFSNEALEDFKKGKNVFLSSYYSGNSGQASRKNLIADSKAIFNYLIDVEKVPSHSIDIMAHSLGCAVALAGLAERSKEKNAEEKYGNITLVSPFSNLKNLIKEKTKILPASIIQDLFKEELWDNKEAITHLVPSLVKFVEIIHGENDKLIPKSHAQELYQHIKQCATPASLKIIPNASHNDVFSKYLKIED